MGLNYISILIDSQYAAGAPGKRHTVGASLISDQLFIRFFHSEQDQLRRALLPAYVAPYPGSVTE